MVRTEFLSQMKRLKSLGYRIIYISKELVTEITYANAQAWCTLQRDGSLDMRHLLVVGQPVNDDGTLVTDEQVRQAATADDVQFAERLPVPLYEPELHRGKVIDYAGTESVQSVRVPSALANRQRRLDRIVARHEQNGALRRARLGNTQLVWIRAGAMLQGVKELIDSGQPFYDPPASPHPAAHHA